MIQMHGKDLAGLKNAGQLDTFSQIQMDETLVRLCDSMGRAERIKGTVFPVTYRLFLHFLIYLFIVILSISLRDLEVYFETPLLLVISIAFFFLEKTASHMQDPFSNRPTDTAMTAIATTIEINIRQLLNETDVPTVVKPETFYLS
jgi:ion channel-forming bestrophin family protein